MSQMPLGTMEETQRNGGMEEKDSRRVYTQTSVYGLLSRFCWTAGEPNLMYKAAILCLS